MSDPEDIHAWQRLDARTTTSGFLRAEHLDRLAELGVRRVINLAMDGQPGSLEGEGALLAERGLAYTHIPVPFASPEETHYAQFVAAYEGSDEPVHVHCMANWRVSAFFYRYNRERGMSEQDARAIMERQWSPETHENEHAPAWARFIAACEG